MLVRFGFRPVAFRNVMTVASNFESRSRIKDRPHLRSPDFGVTYFQEK